MGFKGGIQLVSIFTFFLIVGLIIAHPVTLMLFKDSIEEERAKEMVPDSAEGVRLALAGEIGKKAEYLEVLQQEFKALVGQPEALSSENPVLEARREELLAKTKEQMLTVVKERIDSVSAELSTLISQSNQIAKIETDRMTTLRSGGSSDYMSRTRALYRLTKSLGGGFVWGVHFAMALLFALVCMIPFGIKIFRAG